MASSTYEELSLSKILSKKTAVELQKMARGFYVKGSRDYPQFCVNLLCGVE